MTKEDIEQRLTEIDVELQEVQESLKDAQAAIDLFEDEPSEKLEQMYDEFLDEAYELPFSWSCSKAMQEMDPTMYRCGLLDFHDSVVRDRGCGLDELYDDLEEQEEILQVLEDEREELQEELDDIDE